MIDYSVISAVEGIVEMEYKMNPQDIVGFYNFGSRVYGTSTCKSDYDFVIIFKSDKDENFLYESNDIDIHFYSIIAFEKLLQNHDIMALEIYFCTKPIIEYVTYLELDWVKLRSSISGKSSNSLIKAFKKITLDEEDSYIGIKSLFHSLRIMEYGIQIANNFKIIDFQASNKYWKDILKRLESEELIDIYEFYKLEHKKLKKEFKAVTNALKDK